MSNDKTEKNLAKDTNKALDEVAMTVKNLGKIYEEEIIALEKVDNNAFLELQGKKLAAAREYQHDMGQMLARKNEIKSASPAIKNKLRKLQEDFADLSRKNMEAIERMQRCTERLGNTLRSAVIRDAQRESGYGYSENGAISNKATRRAISSGLSETV